MTQSSILLISRCPPYPLHLGDRLIVGHLARELAARGHIVDLLAFASRPEDRDEIDAYRALFRHVDLFPDPPRSQLDYLRRILQPGRRFPRRAADCWSPEMWRAIESRIAEGGCRLAHFFGGVQVYEYFGALGGLPALITPYESYSLYLRRMIAGGGAPTLYAQRWVARRFEHFMFAPYARTVVIAGPDRDELLGINPALKIEVIPNGIDLETFTPREETRENARLLFVGNYEYAPNVDAALRLARDVLPVVRDRVPEASLWLVGNAPPPEIRALASDNVEVTGRVPDVRPYLAKAAAFVCPLTLGAGMKNKVLEALAMGCPVVATPLSVDGIAVENEHDVLLADVDAIADVVIRLLGDAGLRKTLSAEGRRLIEARYSWGQAAAAYERLYTVISGG